MRKNVKLFLVPYIPGKLEVGILWVYDSISRQETVINIIDENDLNNSAVHEMFEDIKIKNGIKCGAAYVKPYLVSEEQINLDDWVFAPNNAKIEFSEEKINLEYKKITEGFLIKVKKIGMLNDVKKVYDIQVENNSNYLTSSFLVHNSACGSLICYCLGITDVDPIKEDLLFSRFLSESRGGRSMVLEFKDIDPI